MRVFRIHKKARAPSDYDGSLKYPNRWNPAGSPMLYASTHLSLACLEVLVHMSPKQMPPNLVWSFADLWMEVGELAYRRNLSDELLTRQAGYQWASSLESLAILVPSVVLPEEMNVLINPVHSDFSNISWSESKFLNWDKRLVSLVTGDPLL